MFSEPTINFVNDLFNAPGMNLEATGATMLVFGVVSYLSRVAWIALSQAHRVDNESALTIEFPSQAPVYSGPYCAG